MCLGAGVSSCGLPNPETRWRKASAIATAAEMEPFVAVVGGLSVQGFERASRSKTGTLWVYLEGDGLAYLRPDWVSDDPTPINPIALRLAAMDPGDDAVAYIARPCQFRRMGVKDSCEPSLWTTARYGEAVIAAVDGALDRVLARQSQPRSIVLIGYSGGGSVAALLAARRTDIHGLITIAANLDHAEWTTALDVDPLRLSLNPADYGPHLGKVRQVHVIGARDRQVPPSVLAAFRRRLPSDAPVRIIVEPEFDHSCCWLDTWPSIKREARAYINGF
jgi:dienelactone hydrolase